MQMSSEDVVIPPPNMRSLVETTASAVGKTPALESKIIQKKASEPRFSFLRPSDPYHAYYLSKVTEARVALSGNGTPSTAEVEPAVSKPEGAADAIPAAGGAVQEVAPAVSKLRAARLKAERPSDPASAPPPEDEFTLPTVASPPDHLSLDVIKLAALYCFRHGDEFAALLGEKETTNPLFDFLKPMHPNHALFKRLLGAYNIISEPEGERQKPPPSLRADSLSKQDSLASIWRLNEWKKEQRLNEAEGSADPYALPTGMSIDWHEFIVLETIDIGEEESDLPAPMADPSQIPRALAAADAARREWEVNRSDVDMDMDVEMEAAPGSSAMVVAPDVDVDIPTSRVRKRTSEVTREHAVGTELEDQTLPVSRGVVESIQDVRLPDGRVVPVTEATPAMRAQLLDPKYKEERQRAAEKNQRQNLADDAQMAVQLARLNKSKPETGVAGQSRSIAEAEKSVEPTTAGPHHLPDEPTQPAKRARVEAAVDALNQASAAAKSTRPENEKAGDQVLASGTAGDPTSADPPKGLMSEADWLAKVGDKISICVKVPVHSNPDWKLCGQEINLEVPLRSSVLRLKEVLSKAACTKVPANKQKLHYDGLGYLSNRRSLAYCNISPNSTLSFEVRERGGKKKT